MLATFDGHGKKTKVIKVLLWLVSPGTMKMGGDVVAALGKVFPIESGGGMALLQSLDMVQTKLKDGSLSEEEDKIFGELSDKIWRRELNLHEIKIPEGSAYDLLSKWIQKAMECYDQLCYKVEREVEQEEVSKELKLAREQLNAIVSEQKTSGVSQTAISQVSRQASSLGVPVSRAEAQWALQHTSCYESEALKYCQSLPVARKALASLRDPSRLASITEIEPDVKVSIQAIVRTAGVEQLLKSVKEQTIILESFKRARIAAAATALHPHPLSVISQPKNTCDVCGSVGTIHRCVACDFDVCASCYVKSVPTLYASTSGTAQSAAGSSSDGGSGGGGGGGSGGGGKAKKKGSGKREREPANDAGESAEEAMLIAQREVHRADDMLMAELAILRWTMSLADLAIEKEKMLPLIHTRNEYENGIEDTHKATTGVVEVMRRGVAASLEEMKIPPREFPEEKPWSRFPWAFTKPQAVSELRLRDAVGLRNTQALAKELKLASSTLGLSKENSKLVMPRGSSNTKLTHQLLAPSSAHQSFALLCVVLQYFTALALHDKSAASQTLASAATPLAGDGSTEGLLTTLTPAPWAAAEGKKKAIVTALSVYQEDVDTSVSGVVPLVREYAAVLAEDCDAKLHLLRPSTDYARKDSLITMVAESAVVRHGSSDMETEQHREQEQEKEQEQEEEQEMEMERYIDMAYGRDCEEPVPWAFSLLRDPDELTTNGTFYPLSKFQLYGGAPLPFPDYCLVTRNHFDLQWQGDRRLCVSACPQPTPRARRLCPNSGRSCCADPSGFTSLVRAQEECGNDARVAAAGSGRRAAA